MEDNDDPDMVRTKKHQGDKHNLNQQDYDEDDDLFREEIDKGDEFMAVKPWLGAIKAPSDFVKSNNMNKAPRTSLELEYVYGYRAKDCRNNLKQLKNNRLVYHAAALGIVLDIDTNT